ncbi:MAG: hypothetical protein P8Y60_17545 [Calditrichota bacterium]
MKKRISFLGIAVLLGTLFGCQGEQPVDPGTELFGNVFTFREIQDTTFSVLQGTVEVHRGNLSINPVGAFHGYSANALIKFTNFAGVLQDSVAAQDIQNASLILPIEKHFGKSGSSLLVTVHQFHSVWNEDTKLADIDLSDFEPIAMDSVSYPAALDSADTYAYLEFSLDPTVIGTWLDTTSTANQGILLQGTGNSVMVLGASRDTDTPPLLKISTGDSSYTIIAGMDYGIIQGGNVPEPSAQRLVLQQNIGRRFALSWPQFSSLMPDSNVFINSARIILPIEQSQSFAAGEDHQIVVASNSGESPLSVASTTSHITRTVTGSDSALVIESSPDGTFLSNYFQGLLHAGGSDQKLVFFYLNDGDGIQYLTFQTDKVQLKIVYSEIN